MDGIPDDVLPFASQLYNLALNMGASAPLAGYLVGSAYQESGFKPGQLGDYVNGKPTSFGLMQVGSPSLGSGPAVDQFRNYISALQNRAPDTWAAMNAAATPQEAYAAQHQNPDWRMGIPGNRFGYASQVMQAGPFASLGATGAAPAAAGAAPGTPGTNPTAMTFLANLLNQPAAAQQRPVYSGMQPNLNFARGMSAMYPVATPTASSAQGGGMSSWSDYANALTTPSTTEQVASGLGSALSRLGQQGQQQAQQGMNQALQMMQRPSAASAILRQLLASPGGVQDFTRLY